MAAAKFYYKIRYDDYSQCKYACTEMSVDSSYIYSTYRKEKERSLIQVYLPKHVDVTEETLKKSFITAGPLLSTESDFIR